MHASLTASINAYRKELRDQMSSKENYEQEKVNLDCCPVMIQIMQISGQCESMEPT